MRTVTFSTSTPRPFFGVDRRGGLQHIARISSIKLRHPISPGGTAAELLFSLGVLSAMAQPRILA